MGVWDYIQAVVVMGAVIYAAYCVTRLVAKTGVSAQKGKHLRQIAFLPLARDKSVSVVEIAGRAYVLGVSAQRVELLDKLDLDELSLPAEEQAPPAQFAQLIQDRLLRRRKDQDGRH